MLEKMGFLKKRRFDRLLLEELGLVNFLGEYNEEEIAGEFGGGSSFE
jgi:hypothetical protein